jgi:hypothetical protein
MKVCYLMLTGNMILPDILLGKIILKSVKADFINVSCNPL